jgi:hypothetical protein
VDSELLLTVKSKITAIEYKKFLKASKMTQILIAKGIKLPTETVLPPPSASSMHIDSNIKPIKPPSPPTMSTTEVKHADMEKKIHDAKKKLEALDKTDTSKTTGSTRTTDAKYKSMEEELRRLELETMEKTKIKDEKDKKKDLMRGRIDATKQRKKVIAGFFKLTVFYSPLFI